MLSLLYLNKTFIILCPDSEKAMAPHSSTLAWKILWTEEPGRLQSMGWLRVGYDWTISLSLFTFSFHFHAFIGEGNGNPLQCSCLEKPRDGGAWWAAVYGVAQSQTWLKWLSSSSRISWTLLEIATFLYSMLMSIYTTISNVWRLHCPYILVNPRYCQTFKLFF